MRLLILKCVGLVLWALFLFAPFIARAEEAISLLFPLQAPSSLAAPQETPLSILSASENRTPGTWRLEFTAGKDTPLSSAPPLSFSRTPLMEESLELPALRFGIGLNYIF